MMNPANTMNDDLSSPRFSLSTWLWNPFRCIAGWPALIAGIIVILISGALCYPTSTHFDGVLDTHVGMKAPVWIFLSEGIINWLSLAVVLWIGAAILKGPKSFRAIDLFGTQALARWPYLITALMCFTPPFRVLTAEFTKIAMSGKLAIPQATSIQWISFSLVTLGMVLVTIWFVALAWKSFRVSCDVRGGKAIAVFVVGIILAEVISKIAIYGMFAAIPKG